MTHQLMYVLAMVWLVLKLLAKGDDMELSKSSPTSKDYSYEIHATRGRVFQGIGGLSGGGATSRLLVNYVEPYRSQILDFLFKPGFGASLNILKVEIGGDAQSTDGCESSYMHSEDESPDFSRGYEWWLMKEAKARNPKIQLAALSWTWPSWVGDGTAWPFTNYTKTAGYIITWVKGMQSDHGLVINYVGIWNERPYDAGYIKHLRKALDSSGLTHVAIVASDGNWKIAGDMLKDSDLRKAIAVVGAHYPGTLSDTDAINTGAILWASEDYSTFNNNIGAGCWARILNQNYVNGNMTATISWNLIASYYDDLPFKRCSLMTANEPWSGHYEVPAVLWVTAHTTQFSSPGWHYLSSGHFIRGGSYVTLVDPTYSSLTIVIESMSHDNSLCIRPPLPAYNVEHQNVTLNLNGILKKTFSKLYKWTSILGKESSDNNVFIKSEIEVIDGSVLLYLEVDRIITLTSIEGGKKGSFSHPIPASSPFPLPYFDNFDNATTFKEASNFADQSGVFELYETQSDHKMTMRQMVPTRPITWCDDSDSPISVIGDYKWTDINVTVDIMLNSSSGAFVATRVNTGGCNVRNTKGLFLWLHSDMSWALTTTLERNKISVQCVQGWSCSQGMQIKKDDWNTLSIATSNSTVFGYLNSALLFKRSISSLRDVPANGWAAIGVQTFDHALFDNFVITKA